MKDLLINDYRKWLLYSFDQQSFKAHYELYKALQHSETYGSVCISKSSDNNQHIITVSVQNVDEHLQLTEVQRQGFLQYLVENYFHTEKIDDAMDERDRRSESESNHKFVEARTGTEPHGIVEVKPHPKESFYFRVRVGITTLFYLALLTLLVYGVIGSSTAVVIVLMLLPYVAVFMLFRYIGMGIFTGIIRGCSIRITKEQYPEIYQIIEEQAGKLQVAIPEIYITSGHFNAFVTKFARSHILLIFSEVVETALKGNYEVLKYVTAHELCHIKQRHLSKEKWLFPSKLIPFLGLAYSRGCEYTCDRVGYTFSPQGAVEGILIMTIGHATHSKFNVEQHVRTSLEGQNFWTWLSEKFLTHPHLYKRLVQIKEYSRRW